MENNNTQLPAELMDKIKAEANIIYWETHKASIERDPYTRGLTMFEVAQVPIINALTEYATKLHQVEQENRDLKETVNEIRKSHSVLNDKLIGTLHERHELQAKCDRYEAALKKIIAMDGHMHGKYDFNKVAIEALSAGEGKEVENGQGASDAFNPDQTIICVECKTKPATTDYNGNGHYVCKLCDDSLNREFENEYQ
jgi:hypothetical protein